MASVNKVILLGHLGRDPEIRTFQNGGRICRLSVATSENWRDKTTGDRKSRTEWHRVVILHDPLIEIAGKYLKKGSKAYFEGRNETRTYEKDGRTYSTTEVVLRKFHGEITLVDNQDNRPPDGSPDDYDRTDAGSQPGQGSQSGRMPALDDEIPF